MQGHLNPIARFSRSCLLGLLMVSTMGLYGCPSQAGSENTIIKKNCAEKPFKTTTLQKSVRSSVVRIIAGGTGSGTGFVLKNGDGGDGELYFATNYHVVAAADSFEAEWENGDNTTVRIVDLEVVKVNPKEDLALLKTSSLGRKVPGLNLNSKAVSVGQEVAAFGFPFVTASDFTLTVEGGEITAEKRTIDNREFIQSNANINPGNSGGPVVDACGHVVGIATGKAREQERISLIVPVARLIELYRDYKAPRKTPEEEIEARIQAFFDAVNFEQAYDAAGFMSRGFLRGQVQPVFEQSLDDSSRKLDEAKKVLAEKGYNWDSLNFEQQLEIMEQILSQEEFFPIQLLLLIESGQMNVYQGLRAYFAIFINRIFDPVDSSRVVRYDSVSPEAATLRIEAKGPNGVRRYIFNMKYEWGDWVIDGIEAL